MDPHHPALYPSPQEGSTHRRHLRAGSCWLQERERQRCQWGEAGGQAAMWRGDQGLPAGPECQPRSRHGASLWKQRRITGGRRGWGFLSL